MKLHTLTSQPLACIAVRAWARVFGGVRERERCEVLPRAQYAYGMLRAADVARLGGKHAVTVCEFGVAGGRGLLNMAHLADLLESETGVRFRVVGFDTGGGLPAPRGCKDHPELWRAGDFPMVSRDTLAGLDGRAELILGDIHDTIGPFTASLGESAPLGFVAADVDLYTSAKDAMRCLEAPAAALNPAIAVYLDDVGTFFSNRWCGELSSVHEFNAEHAARKIDVDRSLPGTRPVQQAAWHRQMYVCHVLDHPLRNGVDDREPLSVEEHDRRFAYLSGSCPTITRPSRRRPRRGT